MIKTLSIETSCDDTSVGIVSFDWQTFEVEELTAYSQVKDHQQYGGVVPEIASRLHSTQIIPVIENIWRDKISQVDFISVTTHPWLPGSLLVGKTAASMLSKYFEKPLVKVNHIHGHIVALLLERKMEDVQLPMIILTASWWHNDIYLVTNKDENIKEWTEIIWPYQIEKIGYSLDDAAGECFDKISRMIGGPYPGWPWISQQATQSQYWATRPFVPEHIEKEQRINFHRIWLSADKFEFSFSGMKSQVHNFLEDLSKKWQILSEWDISDIAYEFQESVCEVLAKKLIKATVKYGAKTIWISGGVSANDRLYEYVNGLLKDKKWISNIENSKDFIDHIDTIEVLRPTKKIYSTDNSAMIWVAWILSK